MLLHRSQGQKQFRLFAQSCYLDFDLMICSAGKQKQTAGGQYTLTFIAQRRLKFNLLSFFIFIICRIKEEQQLKN